jgi:hypothetical protein
MNAIFDLFIALKNAAFWPRRVSVSYQDTLLLQFNGYCIHIFRDEKVIVFLKDKVYEFDLSDKDEIVKLLRENV